MPIVYTNISNQLQKKVILTFAHPFRRELQLACTGEYDKILPGLR